MFAALVKKLLTPAAPLTALDGRLALSALMVRIARMDHLYAAPEVERIEAVLMQRDGLDAFAAHDLRIKAEILDTDAPDTIRFTRALKESVPLQDRTGLLVALWSVALADGDRDPDEDQMLRLICNLLGLTDVESGLARQKAALL